MKKFLFLLIIFVLIDIFIIEPNMLVMKKETFCLPNWDSRLNGYKIAVVSDLHIGTHFVDLSKVDKVVSEINSQNPDLIVLLGDLDSCSIDASGYSEADIVKSLKNLRAKDGVISVLGNHDYEPDKKIVTDILRKSGISLLENSDKYIKCNNAVFRVYGFEDLWHRNLITDGLVSKPKIPTIVLSHNPDVFVEMPNFVSLTLSGHTHGGEIYLPFLGAPFVPSEYGQEYRKGYVVENNKHIYISGGVASLSRMRFFNPPEVSILTIVSENK